MSRPFEPRSLSVDVRRHPTRSGGLDRVVHPTRWAAAFALAAVAVLVIALLPTSLQAQSDSGCQLCHGEVELLRQHVPTLAEAERLAVTDDVIARSAHAEESCASCHTGYSRWPHSIDGTTESCISCHEEQNELFEASVHAHPGAEALEPARCADCHGTHDIRTVAELGETPGIRTMNSTCVSCHETQVLITTDPHADSVSCASCHLPHATRGVDEARSGVAPLVQAETCGACHEDAAAAFPSDGHGAALAESGLQTIPALDSVGYEAPPTCTTCHGGHGMLAVDDPAATVLHVDGCAACHADEGDRYFGTYHGKATALGSKVVASCDDCHGAHGIYASSEPESWVHESQLIETCGSCHEHARPAFITYDSHPNPLDADRNKPLFFSFVMMNTLLLGVLVVFGLHTLLWWVRILLDGRKAAADGGSHG
jgi:nitrate/TMAO reductase-like tetraheme cytochrome c subunit